MAISSFGVNIRKDILYYRKDIAHLWFIPHPNQQI